ncbi:MAG: hypothetical protein DRH08_01835 [Deltaproteobacteria bacterium]|nr:MAG: hypothetical protein DRH08_01835 [Deltaproteobacteria bacterium]
MLKKELEAKNKHLEDRVELLSIELNKARIVADEWESENTTLRQIEDARNDEEYLYVKKMRNRQDVEWDRSIIAYNMRRVWDNDSLRAFRMNEKFNYALTVNHILQSASLMLIAYVLYNYLGV